LACNYRHKRHLGQINAAAYEKVDYLASTVRRGSYFQVWTFLWDLVMGILSGGLSRALQYGKMQAHGVDIVFNVLLLLRLRLMSNIWAHVDTVHIDQAYTVKYST
jgi:hypothetical protein